MPRVVRSSRAELDMAEIGLYLARDDPAAANRMLDRIEEKIATLAEQPGLGSPRPELSPDMRCSIVGSYVIYYRPTDEAITLIRVLHGARDVEELL